MCKKSHFLTFLRIYYWVEFLLGWVLTYENEKFDVLKNVNVISYESHGNIDIDVKLHDGTTTTIKIRMAPDVLTENLYQVCVSQDYGIMSEDIANNKKLI